MRKRLFIAEKPSMGKAIALEIANISGIKPNTQKTHVAVGNDIVTWCFGHLLELAPPQNYDPKFSKWNFDDLPIIPNKWKMKISDNKKSQVDTIKYLLRDCDDVIHAGDPGREGQLIVDELLSFLNNKKPVKRILLNALDSKSIQSALNSLEDNSSFLPVFKAGQARSHADWNMGMNLTRAFTVLGRKASFSGGVLSVGRVQTPTLSIVVKRDEEIESFIPKDYWVPFATFSVQNGEFKARWKPKDDLEVAWLDDESRIIDKKMGEHILNKIKDKTGVISNFEKKQKSISPPLPFSLSMLQTFANSKWGITASNTLKLCQDLYESKLTSYPRTDCQYLPPNQFADAKEVLNAISVNLKYTKSIIDGADITIRSSAWNEKKLSEHHAIIPTRLASEDILNNLSNEHKKLYDIISKRYISQFYENCDVEVTNVDVFIENEIFHATGQTVVNLGWKSVYSDIDIDEDNDKDKQNLPKMSQGENAICTDVDLKESQTTPPNRFNDGTLIKAMTNVHQLVDDDESKKRLKDVKGIGTEATRSNILETLVSRGFLKREKKTLISTTIGRGLIHALPKKMVDPALTALWENAFDAIAKSESNEQAETRYNVFMDKINAWLKQLLSIAHKSDFSKLPIDEKQSLKSLPGHGDKCSLCSNGTMLTREIRNGKYKGNKFLGCSNYPECKNSKWP